MGILNKLDSNPDSGYNLCQVLNLGVVMMIVALVGLALMLWGVCMSDEDVGFGTMMIGAVVCLVGSFLVLAQ